MSVVSGYPVGRPVEASNGDGNAWSDTVAAPTAARTVYVSLHPSTAPPAAGLGGRHRAIRKHTDSRSISGRAVVLVGVGTSQAGCLPAAPMKFRPSLSVPSSYAARKENSEGGTL